MRLFWWLLRALFALLILLISFLLPIVLVLLRGLIGLISISFAATVNGPRPFVDRLAGEWTHHLLERGAPPDRIDLLFGLCQFAARSIIVLGWIISIVFTVQVLRVVFGFFI